MAYPEAWSATPSETVLITALATPQVARHRTSDTPIAGFELASVQVERDRLHGELVGAAAADWAVLDPEGTEMLDIRETLRSDEGAVIFAQYQGRLDAPQGWQYPMTIYVVPRFETGDERYTWLNRIVRHEVACDEWYSSKGDRLMSVT
jgi:Protein of unknown function (DUF3237)